MTNKNYDDISDNEVRIIGVDQNKPKGYFCRAFVATCPMFMDTGLCTQGNCVHADESIPSDNEMLRLQLIELRRTQIQIAEHFPHHCGIKTPYYKPKTR